MVLEVLFEDSFRGLVGEAAVAATTVVEGLEVVEDGASGLDFGGKDRTRREGLGLEGGEEAFRRGIVVAIEPPPTPGLRREGSRGDEKGNS